MRAPDVAKVNTAGWRPGSPWGEVARLDADGFGRVRPGCLAPLARSPISRRRVALHGFCARLAGCSLL
jgi:hypothetical protein